MYASPAPLRAIAYAAMLIATAVPHVAHASAVVLAPLIPGKGVSAQKVSDLFTLMSSELEFMAGVDEVIEVNPAPASLDRDCLASTACLGSFVESNEGDVFVGGVIDKAGEDYVLDMLFYDAKVNRVLRRKSYPLSSVATNILEQVNPMLVELVTGAAPAPKRSEEPINDVEFDPDDAPPATPPPPAEFDPNAFSFGTDSTGITFGEEDVTFEPDPAPPDEEDPEDLSSDPDDEPEDENDEEDLPPVRRPTGTSSGSTRPSQDDAEWKRVHIAVRAGYTKYGIFNFATVGGELGVRLGAGLFFVGGLDVHMVRRALPESQVEATGKSVITQFVYPVNAGLVYHLRKGKLQPYVGADFLFSHIRKECISLTDGSCDRLSSGDTAGAGQESVDYLYKNHWTLGGRGRLGLDILLAEHVGLNLDIAMGYWSGKDWPNVDPRLPAGAFVPHVAGGLLFAF